MFPGRGAPGRGARDLPQPGPLGRAVGSQGVQQLLSVAGQLPVHQGFAFLVQDTDIEAASVEVDTTVVNMLSGVESHRGLLSWSSQPTAYRGGRLEGASNQYPSNCSGRVSYHQRWRHMGGRGFEIGGGL